MATREFGIRDLRNDTSSVIEAVEHGDQVYITNRGRRVVQLIPAEAQELTPMQQLLADAAELPKRDTGAFDELMAAKRADIEAQAVKSLA